MSVNGKSITHAVREVIDSDLSFQDSLERGYCNISAVARIIKPQVNRLLGRNIRIESIITALKRSRKLYDIPERPMLSILANGPISVKTDVAKISTGKSKRIIEKVAKALTQYGDNFISVSESILSITIVFDDTLLPQVKGTFANYNILEVEDDLAQLLFTAQNKLLRLQVVQLPFTISLHEDILISKIQLAVILIPSY